MLDFCKYIFSDTVIFLKFLIVLWMLCPWLHVRRRVHIFGKQTQRQQKPAEEKKEQIVVRG